MKKNKPKSGFSLVELSIVLVILGLLVGGILGGQSLIRAAELRNVTVEHQQLQTAINTFRQKYHAFPGDMPNATRFWGRARPQLNGCVLWYAPTEPVSPTGGTDTCNGNGSGDLTPNNEAVDGRSVWETALFWSHLFNAGLLNNPYDVYPKSLYYIGMNSRLSSAGWIAMRTTSRSSTPPEDALWIIKHHTLSSLTTFNDLAILQPEEAWNIDQKMDDGKPFTGIIFTAPAIVDAQTVLPDCTVNPDGSTTVSTDTEAEYKLGYSGVACTLMFEL